MNPRFSGVNLDTAAFALAVLAVFWAPFTGGARLPSFLLFLIDRIQFDKTQTQFRQMHLSEHERSHSAFHFPNRRLRILNLRTDDRQAENQQSGCDDCL